MLLFRSRNTAQRLAPRFFSTNSFFATKPFSTSYITKRNFTTDTNLSDKKPEDKKSNQQDSKWQERIKFANETLSLIGKLVAGFTVLFGAYNRQEIKEWFDLRRIQGLRQIQQLPERSDDEHAKFFEKAESDIFIFLRGTGSYQSDMKSFKEIKKKVLSGVKVRILMTDPGLFNSDNTNDPHLRIDASDTIEKINNHNAENPKFKIELKFVKEKQPFSAVVIDGDIVGGEKNYKFSKNSMLEFYPKTVFSFQKEETQYAMVYRFKDIKGSSYELSPYRIYRDACSILWDSAIKLEETIYYQDQQKANKAQDTSSVTPPQNRH